MSGIHITKELMRALAHFELPPVLLVRLVWEHLQEVCPTCKANIEAWMEEATGRAKLARYDEAFSKVIALAEGDEARRPAEEAKVKGELAELLRLDEEDRLRKIERATKRFRNPLLAHLLLEESISRRHHAPSEYLALARAACLVSTRGDCDAVEELQVRCQAHLGNALRVNGDYREASKVFQTTRQLLAKHQVTDAVLFAEIDSLEGSLRRDRGELEKAQALFSQALLVFRISQDEESVRKVATKLAFLYFKLGDFEEAIEILYELIESSPADEEPFKAATYRLNLLVAYTEAGYPEDAAKLLNSFRDQLEILEVHETALPRLHWVEGRIARKLDDWTQAERKLQRAIRGFSRLGIGCDAALVLLDLAESYLAQGKLEAVKEAALQAKPLLSAADLTQEALAALMLFQDAAKQGLLTETIIRKIKMRIKESSEGMPTVH